MLGERSAVAGIDGTKGVLWDFDEWLRDKVKCGSEFDEKTLEAIREHFHECLEHRNVRLHE